MRWSSPRTPDIFNVVKKYQLYDRILQRNVALAKGYGLPCSYWRASDLTPEGTIPKTDKTRCYCYTSPIEGGTSTTQSPLGQQGQRDHFLCSGTSILDVKDTNGISLGGGYQRYGYREHIYSTPSKLTFDTSNLIISGTRGSNYTLSGASLNGTLTTERILLTNLLDVNYFLVNDEVDSNVNRIDYYYSTDDITWIQITMSAYTNLKLAKRQGALTLPEGTEYVRFRITLRKRSAASPSPKWNFIKFRYRNMKTLREIDPSFAIDIPAFLIIRDQQTAVIEGSTQGGGWVTKYPLKFKTLPDATIENSDVLTFLQGTFQDYIFQVQNVIKNSYGPYSQILHRDFQAEYIRDDNDIMKIAHLLL